MAGPRALLALREMKEKFPIAGILNLLEKEDNFVFLETARCDAENFLSYVFLRPERVISTFKINEIKDCFAQLDQVLKEGYYVAGFLSYEAGEAFEERLRHRENYDFPLLWFGVYKEPLIYNHRKEEFEKCSPKAGAFIKKIISPKKYKQKNYSLKNIRPNISQNSYLKAITKIKDLIAQGFTYQVNYTFKLKFSFSGSPAALYLNLRNNQSVSYSTFIKARCFYVLSFSPELFFRKKGRAILTRPMKGTANRGKDLKEDAENIKQLANCLKNRSENVMIVDLLRNDLGKISTTGSVRVPQLFNVERYETLFQMTSDIKSRLKSGDLAFDIFEGVFPSGSVTGAPKIKTMGIIRQLEREPRNVYTGSIGFFSPDDSAIFNVAIRTLLIDSHRKTGEMGVGSGIIYDSEARQEFAECRLKANFLTQKPQPFKLIETMLWQPDKGYLFLKLHLRRLENSARYFGFLYNRKDILRQLARLQRRFNPALPKTRKLSITKKSWGIPPLLKNVPKLSDKRKSGVKQNAYRIRLLLDKKGNIVLEPSLLEKAASEEPKVYFSAKTTDSRNPFLYHKTTNRKIYDEEYRRCKRLGYYDAIFTNEKGEITEGAISNIFIRKNGKFYTPPLTSGLLDGVYRRYLLGLRKYPIKEKVLFKEDLFSTEEIYLSNSVRGLVKVQLETKNH